MRFDLERSESERRLKESPAGSLEQLAAVLEQSAEVQGLIENRRPFLIFGAEETLSAFSSLLEFMGGMEPIPTIRYEAVTNWLDENCIASPREREETRYLLGALLKTYRDFREEQKEKQS